MAETLTLAQTRAHWWNRQLLGGLAGGSLAEAIGASGWLRTLGGVDVYLAARARRPAMTRAELDRLVDGGELRVTPAARGCIYLVPGQLVPDLMTWNRDDWQRTAERDLAKIGKSLADVEALAPAVLRALAAGPLTPDAIRKALGGEIPSFGEPGKKIGLTSPLPLALRWLELRGEVERTLEGGRLDTERYAWRKTAGKPPPPSLDPFARVLDAFLAYAGPVTLAQIAQWTGRAQRDVKAALERLEVVQVTVEGFGEAWLRRADLQAAKAAPPPKGIALLAFEDNYLVLHGTLGIVADPRHHAIETNIWGGGKPEPIGEASHVLSRMIVVDGMIAGFWEVDPRSRGAVWKTFDVAPKQLASRLDDATAETATFLLDELGHARSFSLDTMEKVQARADAIGKLRFAGKPAAKAVAAKTAAKPKKAAKSAKPKKPAKPKPKAKRR